MDKNFIKICDNVFYLMYDETTDRPNLGYVKGNDCSVIIDCGTSDKHINLLFKYLQNNKLPLPKYSIITHWHWDHTFGMSSSNTISIGNELTFKHLKKVLNWKWDENSINARLFSGEDVFFCVSNIYKEYGDFNHLKLKNLDIVFKKDFSLDIGGETIIVENVTNSHTDDGNVIYLSNSKVLFLGDILYYDIVSGRINKNIENIILKLRSYDFKYAVLGHQELLDKAGLLNELNNILLNYYNQ